MALQATDMDEDVKR